MYIDIYGLLWLLVICSIAILWYKNLAYKDLAYKSALQFCREADVQLLDQTIVLRSIRPAKDLRHKWFLRRHYQFEFTSTGADRYKGSVTLLGKAVIDIQLAAHRLH
jgi:Protein of unknown function (DUF3301)